MPAPARATLFAVTALSMGKPEIDPAPAADGSRNPVLREPAPAGTRLRGQRADGDGDGKPTAELDQVAMPRLSRRPSRSQLRDKGGLGQRERRLACSFAGDAAAAPEGLLERVGLRAPEREGDGRLAADLRPVEAGRPRGRLPPLEDPVGASLEGLDGPVAAAPLFSAESRRCAAHRARTMPQTETLPFLANATNGNLNARNEGFRTSFAGSRPQSGLFGSSAVVAWPQYQKPDCQKLSGSGLSRIVNQVSMRTPAIHMR